MRKSFYGSVLGLLASWSSTIFAAPVELVEEFNITMSRYGMTWHSESYTVAVDNIPGDKQVFIHRELADGSWQDLPMYLHGPAGSGKEIWKLSTPRSDFGDEFVVKYVVGGSTYWDNNLGQNYRIQSQGYLIGSAKEVAVVSTYVNSSGPGSSQVNVNLVLDNLAYSKSVKVVYTTDDWSTSAVVDANYFGPRVVYGYGSYPNPSANNAEAWGAYFTIPEGANTKFYVQYDADGRTYYDNNYGADYELNPVTEYPAMTLRVSPDFGQGIPMTAVAPNLWAGNLTVGPSGSLAFKFDVYGDWSVNFGDNNQDGWAEPFGANIQVQGSGHYRVFFNDLTLGYSLQAF